MIIKQIKQAANISDELSQLLDQIHREGPKDAIILEKLSYIKEFHPKAFELFEEKIISALGLFYKIQSPNNLYSFLMQGFGQTHEEKYNAVLTPVQASIRRAIDEVQHISISAPTSAGKSFSIRDFIAEDEGDAVVVVPSRALIAEYVNSMKRKFEGNKNVLITSFVDLIYTSRQLRRIFILTPERSKDLYQFKDRMNIRTFFFDEAQISDEGTRGVIFDVTVRRVKRHFPNAKIIFAHPFIENPEAQFSKHGISSENKYAHSYNYGAVGRICVQEKWCGHYYFSPYLDKGYNKKNSIEFGNSFKEFALNGNHSILVYVSKNSIYKGDFREEFQDYISNLKIITDTKALEIIDTIKYIIGADKIGHSSSLVELLKKGIVIHHGSIPLEVRFLIEDFIRNGFSTLCFATSTLAQGVNMPFDIVWLQNNRFFALSEAEKALAFKNLIGRAGRLTSNKIFDYGYVFTANAKLFSKRINTPFYLKEVSVLENPPEGIRENDEKEFIESIQNDTFNDDKNIPQKKVDRLTHPSVILDVEQFLNIFYRYPEDLRKSIGGKDNKEKREQAKHSLKRIFEASLGRELHSGEESVFNQAIDIFFHSAQGRSFSEIVGIRYSFVSARDEKFETNAKFSQPANKLPDSNLKDRFSIYEKGTPKEKVSYDAIMYDTYDYLDQVISFSLSDTFIAAFEIYNEQQNDLRVLKIVELFKYGTNDLNQILLLRYGFPTESIKEIEDYINEIDETKIIFKDTITNAPKHIKELINWYLP